MDVVMGAMGGAQDQPGWSPKEALTKAKESQNRLTTEVGKARFGNEPHAVALRQSEARERHQALAKARQANPDATPRDILQPGSDWITAK